MLSYQRDDIYDVNEWDDIYDASQCSEWDDSIKTNWILILFSL